MSRYGDGLGGTRASGLGLSDFFFFFLSFFFLFLYIFLFLFSFFVFTFFFLFQFFLLPFFYFFWSCTRLRHRTWKTSRRCLSERFPSILFYFFFFVSLIFHCLFFFFQFSFFFFFLVAQDFGTERAGLVGAACRGTLLRSWFQKTCLLPIGI